MKNYVWVVLALGACGDDGQPHSPVDAGGDAAAVDAAPVDVPAERSGSRLKRQWYEAGGTRQRSGITDSARDEDCGAQGWTDGSTRCTPVLEVGTVAYRDAACTVPLGLAYQSRTCSTPAPRYFVEYDSVGCSDQRIRHFYLRGAEVAAAPHYQLVGGSCVPEIENADDKYYAMGAEVPAADLVALTPSEAGSGRLHPTFWTSADGMITRSGVRDTELDARCYIAGDPEGSSGACVPSTAASVNYFADATCATPAIATTGSCAVSTFAVTYDGLNCPYAVPTYLRTGAELAGADAYTGSPLVCTAAGLPAGSHVYGVGAEVTVARPAPSRSGPTRIQNLGWTADGIQLQDGGLYDQGKATACYRGPGSDGVQRCLPVAPLVQTYFRDAACTQAVSVARVFGGDPLCGRPPAPAYALELQLDEIAACTYREPVHVVGAEITTPLYLLAGTCSPATMTSAAFYEVGPVVPVTDFVPMTLVVDP